MATPLDFSQLDKMDKAELVAMAGLAEKLERYPDMVKFMKAFCNKNGDEAMKPDNRNLLSVAFKQVVAAHREAWRQMSNIVKGEDYKNFQITEELAVKYKEMVEKELFDICNEVLTLLFSGPLKNGVAAVAKDATDAAEANETMVFFLKMCADYCRYLAEFKGEVKTIDHKDFPKFEADELNKDTASGQHAAKFYEKANELAMAHLEPTHPTRLGLALNQSVCHYEILGEKDKACDLAKKAFDAAIEKLDTLNDNCYKDSTLIMQLLRDNLSLWQQSDDPTQKEE